jgi:hypothetical protein
MNNSTWPYSKEDWFTLPLKLRNWWWDETDFSRTPPSDKLLGAVKDAINKKALG